MFNQKGQHVAKKTNKTAAKKTVKVTETKTNSAAAKESANTPKQEQIRYKAKNLHENTSAAKTAARKPAHVSQPNKTTTEQRTVRTASYAETKSKTAERQPRNNKQNVRAQAPAGNSKKAMRQQKKNARKDRHGPCIILTLILLLAIGFLVYTALSTQLVPAKYVVYGAAGSLIIVIITAALTWSTRNRGQFIIGLIFDVVLAAILIYVAFAFLNVQSTIKAIGADDKADNYAGIYVLTSEDAESLEDFSGRTYGVLSNNDSNDEIVGKIKDRIGKIVKTSKYDGAALAMDGLLNGDVDAVAMDEVYWDMITEMEGYEDLGDKVKEIDRIGYEVENAAVTEAKTIEKKSDDVLAVYVSGIDSREGLVAKSRCDSNIIAIINKKTKQILLVSTPRDYYVPLSISGGQKDKLTHAGIYGVKVSMDTLEMLYGVPLDYYFRVNFSGFKEIIDAIGGITINSPQAFTAYTDPQCSFSAGEQTVNGRYALAFARERYAFSKGDIQRGEDQMQVIKATIEKMQTPGALANYTSLLNAIEGSFETSMPYDLITELAQITLDGSGSWEIYSYSVNGTDGSEKPYSLGTYAYVMYPNEAAVNNAISLMEDMLAGKEITQEQVDSMAVEATASSETTSEDISEDTESSLSLAG